MGATSLHIMHVVESFAAGTFRVVFLPSPEELARIYDDIADFTGRYLASA